MRFISKITSTLNRHKTPRKQRLDKILRIANEIADQNPAALADFVRLLGRKIQSDYMCRAVSMLDEHKMLDLKPASVWFGELTPLGANGECICDIKEKIDATRALNLAKDLILPWPWQMQRLVSVITSIGPDRPWGDWKQDYVNHYVEVWLPFGIVWVNGGNHSIMTGILQGQGTIETDEIYDLSALFPLVHFDGEAFIRTHDGSVVREAKDFEFAAIFEIGRLMQERGVSA